MVRATGVVVLAVLAAMPGASIADDELSSEDPRGQRVRVEAAVGLMFGSHGVDDYVGDHDGGAFALGLRRGRWFGYGEYALFQHDGEVGEHTISGLLHRASLNGRYDIKQMWFGPRAVLAAWLEVGTGYELVRWEGGGSLGRPDLSVGLGGGIQIGDDGDRIGIGYAVKLLVAPAPERKDDMPGCAGPCYEASGPLGVDVGGLFVILFPFGV